MSKQVVPKKYTIPASDKKHLIAFMEGKKGSRLTGDAMGINHQRVYCIVTSVVRHANMKGKLDFKDLIKKY
jgi:hypothetical protein